MNTKESPGMSPEQKSLSEDDIVTNRKMTRRSFVMRAGLASAAVLAIGAARPGTAAAADGAGQTDSDTNDYKGQTDNDGLPAGTDAKGQTDHDERDGAGQTDSD